MSKGKNYVDLNRPTTTPSIMLKKNSDEQTCTPQDPDMSLRKGFPISPYSYSGDKIETINPTLGKGLDS